MSRSSGLIVFSNWYHLVEGLQASPKEFYTSVEAAVARRQIPSVELSRVDWREGGVLSAKREYLRVTRKPHLFDICGAPFGTGFFVSWWLGEVPGCLVGIPFLDRFVGRSTYYRIDTELMFQEAVHRAVLEVIDGMTSSKGVRALSEFERKPILRGLMR